MAAPTRTRLAALLLASAAGLATLVGCGDEGDPQAEDPSGPAATPSESPAEPTEGSPTGSASAPSSPASPSGTPQTATVPLYFVGTTPIGPRLFREFRDVEADNPVDEALALLAAGDALDPDYSTLLLQDGAPTLVQGDTTQAIGINLPSLDWSERPAGMTAREAKLAVQQIVYSVQGALQSRAPVEFFFDGLSPVFGIDRPSFRAAPQNDVLAFVNVSQPQEGSTVPDVFDASGVANSFETTVPWEIRDGSGQQVLEGFVNAEGWGDRLYPWSAPGIDVSGLAPGTYTFVALTDDPSAGEGGGPTEDTKTITVQ